MKCPKCGYTSFDYNQVCPKCNKDITGEQEKMNLPSFRPEPPILLGALTGDANESQMGIPLGESSELSIHGDTGVTFDEATVMDNEDISFDNSDLMESSEVSFEDSGVLDSGEVSLSDEEDLDIGLELEETGEFEVPANAAPSIPEEESVSDFDLESPSEGAELDLEVENNQPAESAAQKGGNTDVDANLDLGALDENLGDVAGDDLELELDDLNLDDSEAIEIDKASGKPSKDIDAFHMNEYPSEEVAKNETDIDLDDLSMDDGAVSALADSDALEDSLDLEDLDLDLDLEEPEPPKPS